MSTRNPKTTTSGGEFGQSDGFRTFKDIKTVPVELDLKIREDILEERRRRRVFGDQTVDQ